MREDSSQFAFYTQASIVNDGRKEASITTSDSSVEPADLVHCGSCRKLLQDPRSLSCLHSFCLKCLQQHIEYAEKGVTSLSCPTCSTETKLSSGGVADLGVIAFVSRQRNERQVRDKLADEDAKIMCTNCEETGDASSSGRLNEAVTRCFECDEYLCESCTKMHKTFKLAKHHQLFTFDELRSGKVPLSLLNQNTCKKHKDEILMFYCETCDVPMCSKCAVIAHRHPEHKQAELDNAAAERLSKTILELERESSQVAIKVDELIALNDELEQKLTAASAKALCGIDKIKSQFLENLEKTYKESIDKLNQYEDQKREILRKNLTKLKNDRARLSTSRMIARDVTQKGSEYEIAAVYADVTHSLKELSVQKLETPLTKLSRVIFRRIETGTPVINTRLFATEFMDPPLMKMNKVKEFGNLKNGRGIFWTETGSYIVANYNGWSEYHYHVYSDEGELKSTIDTGFRATGGGRESYPWCVVLHPNGHIFGTGKPQYVKEYNEDGTYVIRYSTWSPDNVASDADDSTVQGLALDKDGNLIVGNVTKKYVSIMKPDCNYITSITSMYVPIQPCFISATPLDNIIISSYDEERAVHVIDRTGKVLFTLDPPDEIPQKLWYPTGVCSSKKGDVFVANYVGKVGIYQYQVTPDDVWYIGCNTNDVTQPWGLALSKDEKKLAVVDNTRVKIFEINID
ncbi:E3 ubiquitin-protein ligase TRIM71-like [Amphiura filiformis]|uniref:E3 ubiquitin-protein ligase TRIM71-like n=1 Tax=Amphiura filiformis TaxID=82378 RepID=UPI003B219B0B